MGTSILPAARFARDGTRRDEANGNVIVAVSSRYFCQTEVDTLLGDPAKARAKLGWQPEISFEDLVREMVREDLKLAEREVKLKK